MTNAPSTSRAARVAALRRARPRDRGLRAALALGAFALVAVWPLAGLAPAELFSERRRRNLGSFLDDIRPRPFRDQDFDFGLFVDWIGELMSNRGTEALTGTLALSFVAITGAAVIALVLAPFAARTLTRARPYLDAARPASAPLRLAWNTLGGATRLLAVLMRALPEYLLAFVFAAMLPSATWPAVFALALHNGGILVRLVGESVENLPPQTPTHLRGLGATRGQLAATVFAPTLRGRFLVYVAYRWETCVREATVLGMLGFGSIGFAILDARTRGRYDELVFFVALGAAVVMLGDLASALVRRSLRRR